MRISSIFFPEIYAYQYLFPRSICVSVYFFPEIYACQYNYYFAGSVNIIKLS
jgi:hypothetical protein